MRLVPRWGAGLSAGAVLLGAMAGGLLAVTIIRPSDADLERWAHELVPAGYTVTDTRVEGNRFLGAVETVLTATRPTPYVRGEPELRPATQEHGWRVTWDRQSPAGHALTAARRQGRADLTAKREGSGTEVTVSVQKKNGALVTAGAVLAGSAAGLGLALLVPRLRRSPRAAGHRRSSR